MPKVSVIIPVYQASAFLEKCLNSVIHQTLLDIEIIIINDGSPDPMDEVIASRYTSDPRVTYLQHENRGQGETRNRGIELATGEYLAFVDSDDYMELDMLDQMYQNAVKYQADIVCCETYSFKNENSKNIRIKFNDSTLVSIERDGVAYFLKHYYFNGMYSMPPWDKIYKTELVKEHNVKFGDNRRVVGEDVYFHTCILQFADRIYFMNEPLYARFVRLDSDFHSYQAEYIQKRLNLITDVHIHIQRSPRKHIFNQVVAMIYESTINRIKRNVFTYNRSFHELLSSFRILGKHHLSKEYIDLILTERIYELLPKARRNRFKHSVYLLKFHLYLLLSIRWFVEFKYLPMIRKIKPRRYLRHLIKSIKRL